MVVSAQQRLQRPEARDLVEQLLDHLLALDAVERQIAGRQQLVQDQAQLVAQLLARQLLDRLQIDLLDQLLVQLVLELVVRVGAARPAAWTICRVGVAAVENDPVAASGRLLSRSRSPIGHLLAEQRPEQARAAQARRPLAAADAGSAPRCPA